MTRLSAAALVQLPPGVDRPAYDRDAVTAGIVHLGAGAFHRAHQALLTDHVLASGDQRWGIVAANLRSCALRDALAPQDGLYTLEESGADGRRMRVIGALRRCAVAQENPAALIAAMASPQIRIVSLTVTEKGYCHNPASGELDEDHPDVRHDLANPQSPRTPLGYICAALLARRAAGIAPFTLLSCDNLAANGQTLKRVLTRFAGLRDRDFGRHIADTLACPSTMVDRIVPATTVQDRARIDAALGLADASPVVSEQFLQWIIEDDFPGGRPDWSMFGAAFVSDAQPWEMLKLRLLNGAHSCIAWLGQLAGKETVAEAMASPVIAAFVARLMREEIAPVLRPPAGADVPAYVAALLIRFANPYLRHRTAQIAIDSSLKLPHRLLPTIRARLAAGAPFPHLAMGVAAWMRFVAGRDDAGRALDLHDPLADMLRQRTIAAGPDCAATVQALASVGAIFGDDLRRDPRFMDAVTGALQALARQGTAPALARLNASPP